MWLSLARMAIIERLFWPLRNSHFFIWLISRIICYCYFYLYSLFFKTSEKNSVSSLFLTFRKFLLQVRVLGNCRDGEAPKHSGSWSQLWNDWVETGRGLDDINDSQPWLQNEILAGGGSPTEESGLQVVPGIHRLRMLPGLLLYTAKTDTLTVCHRVALVYGSRNKAIHSLCYTPSQKWQVVFLLKRPFFCLWNPTI